VTYEQLSKLLLDQLVSPV